MGRRSPLARMWRRPKPDEKSETTTTWEIWNYRNRHCRAEIEGDYFNRLYDRNAYLSLD